MDTNKDKTNITKQVCKETGLHPNTVRPILKVIEAPSFLPVLRSVAKALRNQSEEINESINLLQNS